MNKKIIFLLFVCCRIFVGYAQEQGQIVRGTVVDAFTGSPIEGVNIAVLESKPFIGCLSDEKGEFTLRDIQTGRVSLSASLIGYNPQSVQNLMVVSGKETVITIKMEEKVTNLGGVVVTASAIAKDRALNKMALSSARSFSIEETERYAGSLGDPSRMAANYAGVMAGNDARNDIIIRGNSPSGLIWRIEGVEVANPNHFAAQGTTGGPVSMLNSNLLTNSDFMTGAFPSEYGNGLSGVFDVNLRTGNRDKFELTGQIGFNGFEGAVEGPIKLGKDAPAGAFIVDYRYSTLEVMKKLGFEIGTGTAVPEYQDLSVLIDIPTKKIGRFKFIGLFGKSFIALGRSFDKEAVSHNQIGYAIDFRAGLNIGMLTHTLMLSENTRLKSSISYQNTTSTAKRDTIDYTNKQYFLNYGGKLDEDKWSFTTQLRHKFNTQDNFVAGFTAAEYLTSYNDSTFMKKYQKRVILNDIDRKQTFLLQSYVDWQHKFSNSLTMNTGLHHQFYNLNNEHAIEPRWGLKWKITDRQSISLGYGMHSQIQARNYYFTKEYHQQTGTYTENNHNVKFTRAQHYVLGYDWKIGEDFRIKAETYYQHLYKVPVSKVEKEASMLNIGSGYYSPTLDSLENTGLGENYGIELTLEKFLSNGYYALMTVSVFDSKYRAYDLQWRNTAFNTNFAVNFLAGYEFRVGKNNFLTFDTRTVLSGGLRYIPIDLAASKVAGEQKFDNSKIYTQRYKNYFRSDFRIGFKQNLKRISQEWAIDLQNITNQKNIFSEQYNSQQKEINIINQLGFMPMFLYRINF